MNKNLHKLSTLTLVKFQRYLTKSSNCNNAFKIPNDTQNIGKGRSFFVKTYGCQANIRDTETIEGILKLLGFVKSNELLKADLILLNTCAVRENAEKKVFGEIGFLKKLKSINPKFLFGICGCMPQKADTVKKIFNQNTHIDLIFGTHNIHALPMMLNQVINQQQRFVQTPTKENKIIENLPVNRFSKIKAYVNIM
jgi:tRNA-2-methylthio-N6-dimethylallyladenosine synthase